MGNGASSEKGSAGDASKSSKPGQPSQQAASLPPRQLDVKILSTRGDTQHWDTTEALGEAAWSAIENKDAPKVPDNYGWLWKEVVAHAMRCSDLATSHDTTARKDARLQIEKFLLGGGGRLLVTGSSGQGKTILISQALKNVGAALSQSKTALVLRYVGITARSSSALNLSQSICSQLGGCIPTVDKEIPSKLLDAVDGFAGSCSTDVVIVLEGLDQFWGKRDRELRWLVPFLRDLKKTQRVRVLLTGLPPPFSPSEKAITRELTDITKVSLEPLSNALCDGLITAGRDGASGWKSLSSKHATLLRSAFKIAQDELAGVSPFMVKLLSLAYLSSGPHERLPEFLPATAAECFEAWLDKFEKGLTVNPTESIKLLSLITLSRDGLSLDDLKLLISDESVRTWFTASPPPFMRDHEGLWQWEHKVAKDVAYYRYFGVEPSVNSCTKIKKGETKQLRDLAAVLAAYFKKSIDSMDSIVRMRSGRELPRCLALGGSAAEFRSLCGNFSYLETLVEGCGSSCDVAMELLSLSQWMGIGKSGPTTPTVQTTLTQLESSKDFIKLMEVLLTLGRGLDKSLKEKAGYSWWAQTLKTFDAIQPSFSKSLEEYRSQTRTSDTLGRSFGTFLQDESWGASASTLFPMSIDLVSYSQERVQNVISHFGTSQNGKVVVAVIGSTEVRGWDAQTLEELWTTTLGEPIDALAISPTGTLVALGTQTGISIYRAKTGTATALVAPLAGTPTNKNKLKIAHLSFIQSDEANDATISLLASARFGHLLRWRVGIDGSSPEIVTVKGEVGEEGRPENHVSAKFEMSGDGTIGIWWRRDGEAQVIANAYYVMLVGPTFDVKSTVATKISAGGTLSISTKPVEQESGSSMISKWRLTNLHAIGDYPFTLAPDNSSVFICGEEEIRCVLMSTGEVLWTISVLTHFGIIGDSLVKIVVYGSLVLGITRQGWVVGNALNTGSALYRGKIPFIAGEEKIVGASLVTPEPSIQSCGYLVFSTTFGRLASVRLPLCLILKAGGSDVETLKLQMFTATPVEHLAWSKDKTGLVIADGYRGSRVRRVSPNPALTESFSLKAPSDLDNARTILTAEIQIETPAFLHVLSSGKISFYLRNTSTVSIEWLTKDSPALTIDHGSTIISACNVEGKKVLVLDSSGSITLYPFPASLLLDNQPKEGQPPSPVASSAWVMKTRLCDGETAIGIMWSQATPFNYHVVSSHGQVGRYKLNSGDFLGFVMAGEGVLAMKSRPLPIPPPVSPTQSLDSSSPPTTQAPPLPNALSPKPNSATSWSISKDGRACAVGDSQGNLYIIALPDPSTPTDACHVTIPSAYDGGITAVSLIPFSAFSSQVATKMVWLVVGGDGGGNVVAWEVHLTGGGEKSRVLGTIFVGARVEAIDLEEGSSGVKVAVGCGDGRVVVMGLKEEIVRANNTVASGSG
ncbi:hypothetical protein HDU67_003000 [Dinochytrium kinnereticum]|nr:hypothetical protein HDU67_003000 [Dinochytrium kinnereticum]